MARRRRLICPSDALRDGGDGVRFQLLRGGACEEAFVIRFDGRVHAFVNRCAHVPTELDWLPGRFFEADGRFLICATHGALYDPATGECRGGPCHGGRLEAVPVRERDGAVWLLE